ncbi:MAG TPA: YhdP family protein, partial [Casimicrobiaceae bacterium]|nr:YhdP family protein [Casimicrobiaceae bacterium]
MPFARARQIFSPPFSWSFHKTLRTARTVAIAAVILFCALLLAVRFVVFPRVEGNRDAIARLLADEIGQPVEIGSIATGWDGWNPRLDIADMRVLEPGAAAPGVTLPEVRLTVAWDSLVFLELRLKQLSILRPQLSIRRDADGALRVAGMAFDPGQQAGGQGIADWALRQPRIVIRDASVDWRDAAHASTRLLLEHVSLLLENRAGRHRFGLTATPPSNLAAPVDLRGDFAGGTLADWHSASGRLYARLDYADIGAWRQWLPATLPVSEGKGALRVWLEFAQGEPRDVVADLVLSDVQAKLASDLPPLSLTRLEGRIGWHDDGRRREFFTRQLAFSGPGDVHFDPSNLRLTMRYRAGTAVDGDAAFDRLELAPLSQIAAYLPLPTRWRDDLARIAPRGTLEEAAVRWSGDIAAPSAFAASGRFTDVGFAAQDAVPGVTSLSGRIEATGNDGTIELRSRTLALHWPRVFAQALNLESAQGRVRWRKVGDGYAVNVEQLALASADAAAVVNGEYRTKPDGPGSVDGSAQFSHLEVAQVYRYVPLAAGAGMREWLRTSLLAGGSNDARVKLAGDLADFPFADAKKGQFIVSVKAQGVTLDYAAHWPPLTGIDGEVKFDGPHLVVESRNARAFSTAVTHIKAEIADLRAANPPLRIDGEASGPAADFLRFIAESPVDEWLSHATRGAEASGDGKLALHLELPIGRHEGDRVGGEFTFTDNRLKLAGDIPPLDKLNGKLTFSRRDIRSAGLTARILGGPAQIKVAGADERVRIDGHGNADLSTLRAEYPQQKLASRLTGSTDWKFALDLGERSTWALDASLEGVAVDLPVPAAKTAGEVMPLHVERTQTDAATDIVQASYGRLGRFTVQRRLSVDGAVPERALLALGKASGAPDRKGLWIRGDVERLDLDGWLALRDQIAASVDAGPLPLSGVELRAGALDVFGRRFNELRIGASRGGSDWQLDLSGRELAGMAHWQAAAPAQPNGRIVAHLLRLTPPEATPAAVSTAAGSSSDANDWPAIDLTAEALRIKDRDLGKLEFNAEPNGADWRIERLRLGNDDGKLDASGWWRSGRGAEQTTLDADLDVRDAGKYLARFGLPDAVRGAPSKVHGQVSWSGSPQDFDYPTLNGKLSVSTGPGRFIKVDPGLSKLLGVLSLQALKRRLTFDFQDLFAEGFSFDQITGDVRIQNGVMKSDNLKIVGPSARVAIQGQADIARETQQLTVHVQPSLSAGVSVGAAALLLANPVVGAAVAAGSLLAQKAMQDPIEQIFSYGYTVSGSWSDPVVERQGRFPAPAAAAAPQPE